MADLDHMAQRAPLELARQQLEKLAKVSFVEFLGRRELPQYRTQPVAELQHAGIVEPLHGIARFGQHPAIGGEARPLHREEKTVGPLAPPFAKPLGFLRAVVSAAASGLYR